MKPPALPLLPCSSSCREVVFSAVVESRSAFIGGALTAPVLYQTEPAATTPRGAPRVPPLPGSARASSVRLPPPTLLGDGGDGSSGLPSTHPQHTDAYHSWCSP